MNDLATFVRSIRVKNNLSQKEFAEKLGTSQSVVSRWERGTRSISIEQLEQIEKTFNLNFRLVDVTNESQDTQELLNLFGQLNPEMKTSILDFIAISLYIQNNMLNNPRFKKLFRKNVDLLDDLVNIINTLVNSQLDV